MTTTASIRATLDEITPNAKDVDLASLVTDDGEILTIPLALLPGDSKPGDLFTLRIERHPDETTQRKRRILEMQRRLFGG
jgi:hypothetical protein